MREGGREGREEGRGGRDIGERGREGGRLGREEGRREGGEFGRGVQFFLYRNVLFMNSNMMHMLPTVHIIK